MCVCVLRARVSHVCVRCVFVRCVCVMCVTRVCVCELHRVREIADEVNAYVLGMIPLTHTRTRTRMQHSRTHTHTHTHEIFTHAHTHTHDTHTHTRYTHTHDTHTHTPQRNIMLLESILFNIFELKLLCVGRHFLVDAQMAGRFSSSILHTAISASRVPHYIQPYLKLPLTSFYAKIYAGFFKFKPRFPAFLHLQFNFRGSYVSITSFLQLVSSRWSANHNYDDSTLLKFVTQFHIRHQPSSSLFLSCSPPSLQ